MTDPAPPTELRFEPDATGPFRAASLTVVTDTTWTPQPGEPRLGLRDVAARVLSDRDPITETSERLDAWASASDIADLTTVDGTSYWFYGRLRHWMWLQRRIIWTWVVNECLVEPSIRRISCGQVDDDLVAVARMVAGARGLAFDVDQGAQVDRGADPTGDVPPRDTPPNVGRSPGAPAAAARRSTSSVSRLYRRLVRAAGRPRRASPRTAVLDRLARLEREPGRLLVVLQHAAQRVDDGSGARMMNVYLDPIADRLRTTALDPIGVHVTAETDAIVADPGGWGDRILPGAVLRAIGRPEDDRAEVASAIATRVATTRLTVEVDGIDLGPGLTEQVAAHLRQSLTWQLRSQTRIRRLFQRLRPAAILLADEYHRQEWISAARAEGVPVVAIQHGLIYRWHNGYMFPSRPAGLSLPDRLYVFGRWEQRLLTEQSVFTKDEVRIGGSRGSISAGRMRSPTAPPYAPSWVSRRATDWS